MSGSDLYTLVTHVRLVGARLRKQTVYLYAKKKKSWDKTL
ncbi:hypothetical protein JOC94_004508 [Bacillus thermophilus]|uniref:Transposase n=1 Tax=Siminovitchia thermophila TaxID=1245522 RepID=A0ABS2RDR0_9BACI|nr:hypothetical protein [Siminovitchia thermophila]